MGVQPNANSSASNPNPSGISIGSQWNVGSLIKSGINSVKSTIGDVVSNVSPSGGTTGGSFNKVLGGGSNFVPLDAGPEKPEPKPSDWKMPTFQDKPGATPTPTPTPTPTRIYGPPNGGYPVNQVKKNNNIGANQNYQLGLQGVVGGSGSYRLGSSLTANNAPVTGRANGGLTSGMWSYGGASRGYSGGATGSSFSGLPTDRGRR